MSKGRKWLLLGAAALALLVAFIVFESEPLLPEGKSIADREAPLGDVPQPALAVDNSRDPASFDPKTPTTPVDESIEHDGALRADDTGELVLDEQTRLNIETLVARSDANNLHEEMREQIENLPPNAARQAQDLIDKFVNYQEAQRQTQPPDTAPITADEAVRQLGELHALREAHFGPEVARRFYGKEEVIAREMIEVMRLENDQSLTPEEKLERARALREQLPGVAAIEKRNRESDATQKQ